MEQPEECFTHTLEYKIFMPIEVQSLIAALKERKLITSEQEAALQKRALSDVASIEPAILKEGWADEETLTQVKVAILGIPYVDLSGRMIAPNVLNAIPPSVAENYKMVAFDRKGNELLVAFVDQQDFKAIEAVDFLAQEHNLTVRYHIISLGGLRHIAKQYGELTKEAEEALAGVTEK